MELSLNTPALLFPAASLILLAYTNRFNNLAALIRSLHARWQEEGEEGDAEIRAQLRNLRLRLRLIRDMQGFGIVAMFLCVLCMFQIYLKAEEAALITFGGSLLVLMLSLALSLWEIWISTGALQVELRDMEEPGRKPLWQTIIRR